MNELLNNIFDRKTSRYLSDQYSVQIDSRGFRRKMFSEKVKILNSVAELIGKFECFPRKKKQLAQLISVYFEQKSRYKLLRDFCNKCLENLIDDIENVNTYKIVQMFLSKKAKMQACSFWYQKNGSFLYENGVVRRYNLFKLFLSGDDYVLKIDLILLLQNFDFVEQKLSRDFLTGWEFDHERIVVSKYVHQCLKLLNYIWTNVSGNVEGVDIRDLETSIGDMNRWAMPKGFTYCLSKFWYDLKACFRRDSQKEGTNPSF